MTWNGVGSGGDRTAAAVYAAEEKEAWGHVGRQPRPLAGCSVSASGSDTCSGGRSPTCPRAPPAPLHAHVPPPCLILSAHWTYYTLGGSHHHPTVTLPPIPQPPPLPHPTAPSMRPHLPYEFLAPPLPSSRLSRPPPPPTSSVHTRASHAASPALCSQPLNVKPSICWSLSSELLLTCVLHHDTQLGNPPGWWMRDDRLVNKLPGDDSQTLTYPETVLGRRRPTRSIKTLEDKNPCTPIIPRSQVDAGRSACRQGDGRRHDRKAKDRRRIRGESWGSNHGSRRWRRRPWAWAWAFGAGR